MEATNQVWSVANECVQVFSKLAALRIEAADEKDKKRAKDLIEDSRGRFQVWAANIGARQLLESRKSLDFRLKDSPLVRSSVISGLQRLRRCATKIAMILCGEAPNRNADDPSQENSASRLEGTGPKTTELDELFLNLSSSIDHLFGLSMLIRRMRPKGRLRNLELAPADPRDVVTVMDKFPKLNHQTWLARRLGNAISQRRQYFVYRQEHRQRLASRKQIDHEVTGDQVLGAEIASTIATTFVEKVSGDAATGEPGFDRRSIHTSATSLVSDCDENQEMGRRIPDLPDMVLDGVKLDYGLPIECPYCRTIQEFRNRLEWKRHVFSDLQPYVCTLEKCDMGLFPTRHEWYQHELQAHRRRWQCILCDDSDVSFLTEERMTSHFEQQHAEVMTHDQTEIVLNACERQMNLFDSSACALCNEWNPPSTQETNVKQFFQHLARHQQRIALEALPVYIEGLEIQEVKTPEASDESDSKAPPASPTSRDGKVYKAWTCCNCSEDNTRIDNIISGACWNCSRFRCPECTYDFTTVSLW